MLKILGGTFTLLSCIILSFLLIIAGSSITYYSKGLFGNSKIRSHPWIYSAVYGMLLEILLAFLSIISMSIFSADVIYTRSGVRSWLYRGACCAALFSPLTCIISAGLGIRCRKAPWKYIYTRKVNFH